MTDAVGNDRVIHLEETVLDELERTVVCAESEPIPPPKQHVPELQGPHGGVRCPSSQRELLRSRFFVQ